MGWLLPHWRAQFHAQCHAQCHACTCVHQARCCTIGLVTPAWRKLPPRLLRQSTAQTPACIASPSTATAVATAIAKASATAIAEAGNKCCPTQAQAIANALAIDKQVGRSELGQGAIVSLCGRRVRSQPAGQGHFTCAGSWWHAVPGQSAVWPSARHSAAVPTSPPLLPIQPPRLTCCPRCPSLMPHPDRHSHRLGGRRCLRQRRRQRQRILHCHCHSCGELRAAGAVH